MRVSTNALLFRGFVFHDIENNLQLDWMLEYENDWRRYYLDKINIKDTSGFLTKNGNYAFKKGSSEFLEAKKKYYEYVDKDIKIIGEITLNGKIELSYYCHRDCPVYYVSIGTYKARHGYSSEIDKLDKILNEEAILKDFCHKMDIPYQDPKWLLASYWR